MVTALSLLPLTTSSNPPLCFNLTGFWCCETTNVTQSADGRTLTTLGDYGSGLGTLEGLTINVLFSNAPNALNGSISTDCNSILWSTGVSWTRVPPPRQPVAAPEWASTLSGILEINALTYTSPNGNGTGDGSGTWSSLTQKVEHLRSLGVGAIWLAYYNVATTHFYGIRSVYAATDPETLDTTLGSVDDFDSFITACHDANIKVFLDVIGHGLVNNSKWVMNNPEWFAGGSWGMVDFNYSSPGFLAWWATIWLEYALARGADGYRIDIADPSWWESGVWDDIANSARIGGHEVVVFGEGSRYHFSQHDFTAPLSNITASVLSARNVGHCLNTLQFSCHDSGWENVPGNYFFLRGSRAHFAYGVLSPFTPLWLGGDEYDEDPIIDLPNLKKDLYGTSGLPGGWMYGSVRDWSQLVDPTGRQSLMLNDTTTILTVQRLHSDVLHRDSCTSQIISVGDRVQTTPSLPLDPYARFIFGEKAMLVIASTGSISQHLVVDVPLDVFGLARKAFFNVQTLYGSNSGTQRLSASSLSALALQLTADKIPGGGALVILITPTT
jgi:hypothetical protein